MEEVIQGVLQSIDIIVREWLKNYTPKTHITGVITVVNGDGTVNVTHNEEVLPDIPIRAGLSLSVGQIVLIALVNGDLNQKFVDLVRPY